MKSKTKKVVENISDDSCVSSSSDNESDSNFVIEVDSYKSDKKQTKPIKKRMEKKVTTKDTNKDSVKKTIVEGEEFKKLQRKAKILGAKSLDYSNRKNNKYVVEYEGKKIHFGSNKYEDYLIHKEKERRDKYLARAKKIKNKNGDFTHDSPSFPNYWAGHLLWI